MFQRPCAVLRCGFSPCMNAQFTAKTNCGVHTARISMNKSTTPKPATCNNLTRRCFTQALTCNIFMRGVSFQGEAQTRRWARIWWATRDSPTHCDHWNLLHSHHCSTLHLLCTVFRGIRYEPQLHCLIPLLASLLSCPCFWFSLPLSIIFFVCKDYRHYLKFKLYSLREMKPAETDV